MRGHKREFSEEEIEFILLNYDEMTNPELVEHLGDCNEGHVRYQLRKRNITRTGGSSNWIASEEKLLEENYLTKSDFEIAEMLNRTPVGILKKRLRHNWKRPEGKHIMYNYAENTWTEEEKVFLIENFNELELDELEAKLGRSAKAISVQATRLGVAVSDTSWTTKEDEYLKNNYNQYSTGAIAKYLNRTPRAVYHRRCELKLQREFWASAPERELGLIMEEMGLAPVAQHKIGPFYYDYLVNENILIEFNGDYFHCNPQLYPDGPLHTAQFVRLEADSRKKKLAEDNGYQVIYVWEWDFNNNLKSVKEHLLAVCGRNSTDD